MSCFEDCSCTCTDTHKEFDDVINEETKFGSSLLEISKSNIGWFTDKTIAEQQLALWGIADSFGVYMIWYKEDYCGEHDRFHMKCLYTGKGRIAPRLREHCRKKDFSEEMICYFSFFPCENRKAKYIEQLLLDTYYFPLNKAEMCGTKELCQHWTQWDVD